MDFFSIATKENKGVLEVYPNFLVGRSQDLMVKGRSFFAIWDEATGLWSTDEYDVQRLVDAELSAFAEKRKEALSIKYMRNFDSDRWPQFRKFVNNISDNAHPLDESLIFSNTDTKKEDYATKRLSYPLERGDYSSWDKLLSVLYSPDERAKIEWAIGAIISGDSKQIQKFLVFYGPSGTGKSTVLNIIQKLFQGYAVMFDAKALGSSNNAFSTEIFKSNPLVAIQHDGDLSKIEDNTKLNSIVSHEEMLVNEKYKPSYTAKFNAFLLMGTNQPVKISDAKSGLIRRLIDVVPTGDKLRPDEYNACMAKIDFELGAIAHHCLDVYRKLGRHYYDDYRPMEMMFKTDHVLNFVSDNYDLFKSQEYVSVRQAYSMYKEFCEEFGFERPMSRQRFQSELDNYFDEFHDRVKIDGANVRSVFAKFNFEKYQPKPFAEEKAPTLDLEHTESRFDDICSDMPAQLAKKDGTPRARWANVRTSLSDLDTHDLHYVKVPRNHIVIDFDLCDENGEKDLEANLAAAAMWPPTYAELSKSGGGLHLHYIYDGDVDRLSPSYADGIEVKVYRGDSSLRRKLTRCNDKDISTINSGLPLKEERMLEDHVMKSEKSLRDLIARNLRKEFHPGTKPSVDFIKKILDDAQKSGMTYDVTDMRPAILAFAGNSSNQALVCLKTVKSMEFKSEGEEVVNHEGDGKLAFYDVEVYPNLFVVCWKYEGSDTIVRMINPSPAEMEALFKLKLVGFNNRRYDNHILYGRFMGYDNEALYKLSQRIVTNDRSAMFGEAYNLSYADIYDFSSKKQGLKKFQIELGIDHMEMEIPWDEPVPDDMVDKVVEYCCNDVVATEKVFEARRGDFTARQILADLSGQTPNHTTQNHTAKIIFGNDRQPQKKFVYTDLATGVRHQGSREIDSDPVHFKGYEFDMGKSTYKGEVTGEGGYVYAEPGLYSNVAVLDIASMHPTTIGELDLFGPYTKNYMDLKAARIAIKHGDYDEARKMLDGKLAPYLKDPNDAKDLSYALKIVINIVYGLTSAKFDNPFRDPRNKDNIVAKRGALFMIDLKEEVQKRGFTVAHIKTDSIKIPDATPEIIEWVSEFGKSYGYEFEHEATYDKFCLVNDAVYIAREGDKWEAVGAQFQHPYVYKTLFTKEPLVFQDYCETKSVTQGSIYIDTEYDRPMATVSVDAMRHVGRTGRFVPVKPEYGGGVLYRVKDGKSYAVTGTKGYIWIEAAVAEQDGVDVVDTNYHNHLTDEAVRTINKFGKFEELFT